jgi:hypothetical protein
MHFLNILEKILSLPRRHRHCGSGSAVAATHGHL